MNVWLNENSELMRGDLIAKWVLRSDLVPIPRTVELSVRIKDGIEEYIKEGENFWTGRERLKYRIIKTKLSDPSGIVQGRDSIQVLSAIAVLDDAHRLTFRQSRAVILEDTTFSAIYASCGARFSVESDIQADRFSCFVSQVPTFHIAKALQEECATVVLRNGRLNFVRLQELVKQRSVAEIGQSDSSTEKVTSEFIERHEIPAYFSVAPDASIVHGVLPEQARSSEFIPRTSQRILRNLSRVLVTKRVIPCSIAEHINAGDCVTVSGEKYVVITAAHRCENMEGATDTNSRLWIGKLA